MKHILVIFENRQHVESCVGKFINNIGVEVSYQQHQNIIRTKDTTYKLIGCGFPFVMMLDDKLDGYRFDEVMIHGDVVLTRHVEYEILLRMKEVKEFIVFD